MFDFEKKETNNFTDLIRLMGHCWHFHIRTREFKDNTQIIASCICDFFVFGFVLLFVCIMFGIRYWPKLNN